MFPTAPPASMATPAPKNPQPSVTIKAWRDELTENHPDSIPTHAEDMLIYWTPILGPTATLMAYRFAGLVLDGSTHTFRRSELGKTFGLGSQSGKLDAGLARLERFGAAQVSASEVAVRLAMLPMPIRQIDRLPRYLQVSYGRRR